jgi:hypothetical protein
MNASIGPVPDRRRMALPHPQLKICVQAPRAAPTASRFMTAATSG